jgi:hypothetical protein
MAPDAQRRNQLRARYRLFASWFLCVLQVIIGFLHLYPPLAYRAANATTTRVVASVNAIGGIWFYGLGLTALLLGFTIVVWNTVCSYAHLLCAAACFAYDVQLWVGALGERPYGPIIFPLSFILFVVGHVLLFLSYDGGD